MRALTVHARLNSVHSERQRAAARGAAKGAARGPPGERKTSGVEVSLQASSSRGPLKVADRRRADGEPNAVSCGARRLSRRELSGALAGLLSVTVAAAGQLASPPPSRAENLYTLYDLAQQLGERGEYDEADKVWSRAIEMNPKNSASWSNRGTMRLQALADLNKAVELDGPNADALTLNNRGNAKGAVGDWEGAKADYTEAAKNRAILPIARANYALALFETGDDLSAVEAARGLLRKDPEYWDMRAATTAFLWASGQEERAESEWSTLCMSGRGFGSQRSPDAAGEMYSPEYSAEMLRQQFALVGATVMGTVSEDGGDSTPCNLYRNINVVAGRWPPRCTAALDAFLHLSRTGQAKDYNGEVKTYQFASRKEGPSSQGSEALAGGGGTSVRAAATTTTAAGMARR